MKNHKKILLGLIFPMFFGLFFLLGSKALAYTPAEIQNATYTPVVQSNKVVGFNVSVGGDTVPFVDQDPFDIQENAKASGTNASQFCANTRVGASGNKGISYTNDAGQIIQNNGVPVSVDIDYVTAGGGCATFTKSFVINATGANATPAEGGTCTTNGEKSGDFNCVCVVEGTTNPVEKCTWVGSANTTGTGLSGCIAGSGGNPLGWIICPILDIIDNTVDKLYQGIQNRLCFATSADPNSATNGKASATCNLTLRDGQVVQKGTLLTPETKSAWSSFRVLATSLLVIVMLAMIISQALGSDFFSAYSVKKMLPKLIAAAILIQISFVIAEFAINISNDLGRGIAEIMAAPFGGLGQINDITTQLAKVGGTGQTYAAGIFVGIIVAGLGIINIGGLLLLAIPVVLAVLIGFFVLFLREILILLCVLTIPIAIALWVLPGTERYWRFWKDNFIKLLLMFPLIVMLIYAGKIFASVAATGGDGFFTVVAILIGFFAPLAILPMTFRWGGSALALMANGAMNSRVNKALNEKTRSFAGGLNERSQGRAAKTYDPNAGWKSRAVSRIRSGNYIPFNERSRRLTIAKGDKWAADRNDEAAALVGRTYEKALSGYQVLDKDEEGNFLKYSKNSEGEYLDSRGKVLEDERDEYGNIVKSAKEQAHFEKVTSADEATHEIVKGVAGAKQALVDIAGNDGTDDASKRASLAAHKQLLDTSSWIELQNARVQTGGNIGKRLTEMGSFKDMVENSPQHYGQVIRSRPDQAPDVIESAEKAMGYTYEDAYKQQNTGEREKMIKNLDRYRLNTTLSRMGPEAVPGIHMGMYEEIKNLGDPQVSKLLGDRLQAFKDSGTDVGRNAIGSLTGEQMRGKVEAALSIEGKLPSGVQGPENRARKLVDFLPSNQSTSSSSPSYTAPGAATPADAATPPLVATAPAESGGGASRTSGYGSTPNMDRLAENIAHAVEKGVTRANKKSMPGEVYIDHTPAPAPGDTVSPGGVHLTPGAQRDYERNPPSTPHGTGGSGIITPDSPEYRSPTPEDLPKQ